MPEASCRQRQRSKVRQYVPGHRRLLCRGATGFVLVTRTRGAWMLSLTVVACCVPNAFWEKGGGAKPFVQEGDEACQVL